MPNFIELNEYIKLSGEPPENEPLYKEVTRSIFEQIAVFDEAFRKENYHCSMSMFGPHEWAYSGEHYIKMTGDGMYN